jgi:simple sugar transport system substrate-binding protein
MKNFLKIFLISISSLFIAFSAFSAPLKVGFVYLTTPGDHGWTYAHERARVILEEKFGDQIETTYVENVPEGPDATRIMRELANQGNQLIFATSFGYMDPTIKVAKEFPDTHFVHVTGYKRSENVATSNIRFHEGRYIQGVAAGLMTKSNKIGYIASFPIPEVFMGINAFTLGLKSVNQDATVSVIWAMTWYDPGKEADAAKVHIAEGADVLAQHTDTPSMLQIAQEKSAFGFGQGSDMEAFAPKAQLFASVNHWDISYIEHIQSALDGTWSSNASGGNWDTWCGMKDGCLSVTDFKNMPSDVTAKVQSVADSISSGSFNVFQGPIISNDGAVVASGATLNDGDLWAMNYYVQGVIGKIPN